MYQKHLNDNCCIVVRENKHILFYSILKLLFLLRYSQIVHSCLQSYTSLEMGLINGPEVTFR
jgi:hypothetical protein